MSMPSEARRQSWRQSGKPAAAGASSVRRRKIQTTALLVLLLVAASLLVAFLFNRRDQYTRVASLLTAAPTKTSEPEQAYTWLPLRFGSESQAPLLTENTDQFQVNSLTQDFDSEEKLTRAIKGQIAQLHRQDAFILWIRAKGAEFDGQAYLLSGNYRLPETGEELTSPRGAVPFKSIVEAVSQWTGPVLILLDWGNQLCDPRAGMWDNQFLCSVAEVIQAAPQQVHCLVSHQPGELSLDSLASRQTLFGRACAEGIVGPRRQPAEFQPDVWASNKLLVGDLAEYVIRRVWTDSAQRQKPWLIQGQSGWLSADRKNWLARTRVSLGELKEQHRLASWSDLPQPEETAGVQGEGPTTQPSTATETPENSTAVELSDENWPTGKLWTRLDQWRAGSEKLGGWSLAALAPLSARRLATMAVELEHRWLAGNDFRGEVDGVGLRSQIDELDLKMGEEEKRIEQTARATPFAAVLAERPVNVSAAEFHNWRQRVESLAAYRQLALILSDSASLCDNLAKLGDIPIDLSRATERGILKAQAFLRDITASSTESLDALRPSDAKSLSGELSSQLPEIEQRIAELVSRATSNPTRERPLAELLSRYAWLSHAQRSPLLLSMLSPEPVDPNIDWPTMDLSLMKADPPQRPTTPPLPPKRLNLLETMMSSGESRIVSPAEAVDQLSAIGQSLRDSASITEAAWLKCDGRDLCQKEGGWSPAIQAPNLPAPPQPTPGWQLTWENVAGGQLGTDRLRLHSTSEPASVDVVLTRIGSAQDIQSVQISLAGLAARIAGDDTEFKSGTLKLDHEALLRVVDLKAGGQRLPLQLKALSADQQTQRGVRIVVEAGDNSPSPATLACRLPVDTPVTINVQQFTCRGGIRSWENCERQETLSTINPFPGRKTQFRLLVSNQDSQPRVATVELYRLPSRATTNAKGRISEIPGEIPLELENKLLSNFSLVATSAPIPLEPNAQDLEVDFSSASAAPPSANSPATAPPTPPPANPSAGGADITWGLLAVVRLASEPTQAWRNWIQLRPVEATEFLTASSAVSRDAKTIELEVALKDFNGDNIPDWIPTDLSDEQPIALECEVGAGIDLHHATFAVPKHQLTKDKRRQVFSISAERRIEDEVELQISVDGSSRALFEFVDVGGHEVRREPPDRIKLRSIGVKDGPRYVSDFKYNLEPNELVLDNNGAMFKRPMAAPLEMLLAVDAESRRRVGAAPEQVEFKLVGRTLNQPIEIANFFGDRDLVASLASSGTTLTVECQVTDWKFSFDPSSLGDVEASFQGSIGTVQDRQLAKLILDGRGPSITQSVRINEITAGQTAQLTFQVVDSVPMGEGTLTIAEAGGGTPPVPLGAKLSTGDFVLSNKGWQLRSRTLPVRERQPGLYEIRAQLADVLGNTSELGPWALRIKAKPMAIPGTQGGTAETPPKLTGDINGRLYFGFTKNKPENDVTVKVKDLPEKTVTSSDGKFTISGLDAGEYTLEATTEVRNTIYKGEAQVKLLKKADYQKEIEISLKK